MALTEQQINDLRTAYLAANAGPTDANIAIYYSILEDAGVKYGSLAQGVVLDNTFAGIVANNYANNKITTDQSGIYDNQAITNLKI